MIFNSLVCVAFFLASLQGFYFFNYGIAPFAILGGCLFILLSWVSFLKNHHSININQFTASYVYILVLILSIFSIFYYQDVYDLKRLIGFCFSILICFSVATVVDERNIKNILEILLIVHTSYFFTQFFSYYLFGIDVDLIKVITGVSQKGWGGSFSLDSLGDLRRFGGLYNEPGTYATFISPVLAMYITYFLQSKKCKIITYLTLLSLILTFSTFAFIFSTLIAITMVIIYKQKALFVATTYVLGFVTVIPYFLYRFFERSSYGVDTGTEFRFEFLDITYQYIFSGVAEFFLGTGQLITDFSGKAQLPAALNDSSLFLSLVFTNGPIFAILISLY